MTKFCLYPKKKESKSGIGSKALELNITFSFEKALDRGDAEKLWRGTILRRSFPSTT